MHHLHVLLVLPRGQGSEEVGLVLHFEIDIPIEVALLVLGDKLLGIQVHPSYDANVLMIVEVLFRKHLASVILIVALTTVPAALVEVFNGEVLSEKLKKYNGFKGHITIVFSSILI